MSLALSLLSQRVFAIDLDKIAGAVENIASNQNGTKNPSKKSNSPLSGIQNEILDNVDGVTAKLEEKLNKVTQRIESRVERYEKKFDEYEQKMDKLEKTANKVIDSVNNFDSSQIAKYLTIAKYAAIGFVSLFLLFIVLLILVFVQLIRVSSLLKNNKK